MKEKDISVTQPNNPHEDVNLATLPDGYSPVAVIVAISLLIGTLTGAIAKIIQVLVPVMMKDRNRK